MTDAVEPPTPLPPAGTKTPTQIAAIITVLSGVALVAFTYLPAIYIDDSVGNVVQSVQLSSTIDGPLFIVAGILITAFGIARYLADQTSFRILAGITGAGALYMVITETRYVDTHASQHLGIGATWAYGWALQLVAVAALSAIISSESQTPLVAAFKRKPNPPATVETTKPEATASAPAQAATRAPAVESSKPNWLNALDAWGSKPDWSSKLGSGESSDNVAVLVVLGILAVVGIIILVTVVGTDKTTSEPSKYSATTDYTIPTVVPPAPVEQVAVPVIRGVYPAETEVEFLQSCEASATTFANAKCNCDLSRLESSVSLARLEAIESATAAGEPLPPDVAAMFDACRFTTQ